MRVVHVLVKFRYTRLGRWVARSLPPSWQRRLKARRDVQIRDRVLWQMLRVVVGNGRLRPSLRQQSTHRVIRNF